MGCREPRETKFFARKLGMTHRLRARHAVLLHGRDTTRLSNHLTLNPSPAPRAHGHGARSGLLTQHDLPGRRLTSRRRQWTVVSAKVPCEDNPGGSLEGHSMPCPDNSSACRVFMTC